MNKYFLLLISVEGSLKTVRLLVSFQLIIILRKKYRTKDIYIKKVENHIEILNKFDHQVT